MSTRLLLHVSFLPAMHYPCRAYDLIDLDAYLLWGIMLLSSYSCRMFRLSKFIWLLPQELKQARSDSQNVLIDQGVEVDCLLADKCRDIILGNASLLQ